MTSKTNLIVQLLMGVALLVGMMLARSKKFRAHAICQTTVVLLNLIPILSFMGPTFEKVVLPDLPGRLSERFYSLPAAHAALGSVAELLGIYIILNSGTQLLPVALRFRKYKPWMRTELALWWLVIALGVSTYWVWNVAKSPTSPTPLPVAAGAGEPQKTESLPAQTITISNFAFEPRNLEIKAGTTVIWSSNAGRHTVTADDGSFDSPIMASGEQFRRTFERPGMFPYFCKLHGAAGGQKMSGLITVK